jgi:hypothetical protein
MGRKWFSPALLTGRSSKRKVFEGKEGFSAATPAEAARADNHKYKSLLEQIIANLLG